MRSNITRCSCIIVVVLRMLLINICVSVYLKGKNPCARNLVTSDKFPRYIIRKLFNNIFHQIW